ncbi:MAG: hypothetical protein KBD01_05640 [Acidobacteria bacterium]|nr:hypothetical protein [Acidobacteriota bacterium]
MRGSGPWLLALLVLVTGAPVAAQVQRMARVSYVTSSTVYIDAGSNHGLDVGDVVEVVRGEQVVGLLRVTFVSSLRAACERQGEPGVELQVGDLVRFTPRGEAPVRPEDVPPPVEPREVPPVTAEAPRSAASPGASLAGRLREAGLRGRVGVRYNAVRDRSGAGLDYSQPGLDLRLDGDHVLGSPISLNVDVRAFRTYRTTPDGGSEDLSRNRVYRLSGTWQPVASRWRVTAGRQFSPSMATINLFDGVMADYTGERWSFGALTGTQPDPIDFGYSSETREHGAFAELRGGAAGDSRWAVTGGLIGSYDQGEINREYVFLQGRYDDPSLSAYLAQEVDFNRGWKDDVEGKSVSPTSTFATVYYRASENLRFNAGYDNRRNVRLFRDRVTPETEFDDEFRRGVWAGADLRFLQRYRVGVSGRVNGGGDAGSADSFSLYLGAADLSAFRLDLRTRSTRYTSDRVEGWLHSLSAGVPIGERMNVQLTAGLRDETRQQVLQFGPTETDARVTWFGVDFDAILGRRWLFLFSAERDQGDIEANDQVYAAISYRF